MNVTWGVVSSGKCSLEEARDIVKYSDQTPRFGRYWWLWLPRLRWNGGLPWRDTATDLNFQWLCLSLGCVIWR